jgi:hypothetical protein
MLSCHLFVGLTNDRIPRDFPHQMSLSINRLQIIISCGPLRGTVTDIKQKKRGKL